MTDGAPAEPRPASSRRYLIPAVAALGLGATVLWAHWRQPTYPAGPGLGCIVVQAPSPDSVHLRAAYLELRSCPHISETVFDLGLSRGEDDYAGTILMATGPEDPRAWARSLRFRWEGLDTVVVEYSADVRIEHQEESVGTVRVRYLRHEGPLP